MRTKSETFLRDPEGPFAAWNESLFEQFRTEVAGMLVRHHCAFVRSLR
jgi:hypothetical protein